MENDENIYGMRSLELNNPISKGIKKEYHEDTIWPSYVIYTVTMDCDIGVLRIERGVEGFNWDYSGDLKGKTLFPYFRNVLG